MPLYADGVSLSEQALSRLAMQSLADKAMKFDKLYNKCKNGHRQRQSHSADLAQRAAFSVSKRVFLSSVKIV